MDASPLAELEKGSEHRALNVYFLPLVSQKEKNEIGWKQQKNDSKTMKVKRLGFYFYFSEETKINSLE